MAIELNSSKQNLWNSQTLSQALRIEIAAGLAITMVAIDSRKISAGGLFIALKGQNFNGNEFAVKAIESGAAACLVDEDIDFNDDKIIKVSDCMVALNQLALYKRECTRAKIFAVTGSAGKTTTKEMLKMALDSQGSTYASFGNYNNHLGLPLSLANMPEDSVFGVFELGMNHKGEISALTRMLRPHISIITTVDAAHLEFFDSVEDIARAKSEIFEGMNKGDYAIINRDNKYYPIMHNVANTHKLNIISFGSDNADYALRKYEIKDNQADIEILANNQTIAFSLKSLGKHLAMNALSVIAAAECADLDAFIAAKSLEQFTALIGRGEIVIKSKGIKVINDCYNSNLASIKSGIESLKEYAKDNRSILIMGDIKELGSTSKQIHESVSEFISKNDIDKVFCVGDMSLHLYNVLPTEIRGANTKTSDEMAAIINQYLEENDMVLIKGSRSMKMEVILDAIK